MAVLLASVLCVGCGVKVRSKTTFPKVEPFDLRVDLVLTEAFRNYTVHYETGRFQLGSALERDAHALASNLFREVHVVDVLSTKTASDAILMPVVLGFTPYTKPRFASDNYFGEIRTRWDLRAPNGDIIWSRETSGEGSAFIVTALNASWPAVPRKAMEKMFLETHKAIASDPLVIELAIDRQGEP